MKILIAGGCGFVGSNLCIHLKKRGFNISSADNLQRNGSKYNLKRLKTFGIKNKKIDLSNNFQIKKLSKFYFYKHEKIFLIYIHLFVVKF